MKEIRKFVSNIVRGIQKNPLFKQLVDPASKLQTILLTAFAATAYLVRARQYFFKPQLFAEDGVLWLAEGHNKGISALLQPVNGFLHFPERLFGYIMAHLSLEWAPLAFVTAAWILFIFTVYYLLSPRTRILNRNYERVFMVLCLALIANMQEFFFNFSNSIFLMGIIGVLIMIASEPRSKIISIIEKTFFVLSGLTLPFAWFYLPIALFERLKYKRKNNFFLYASGLTALAELVYFLTSHVNRSPVTLISLFSKYTLLEIYNQMVIPAVRFARIDTPVAEFSTHYYFILSVSLTVIAVACAGIYVLRHSKKQVWYLLFFLAAMTFASIKSPTVSVESPVDALKTMAVVRGAHRYFVYGIIGVNLIVVKTAGLALIGRVRYAFMAIFIAFGVITSVHYQSFFIEKQFQDFSKDYSEGIKKLQSGEVDSVDILVNPTPWHMLLSR